MSDLLLLLPALAFSLLLVLTHTYFGLHVLARGIIFVDLALAQIAALGASLAFLLGRDPHGAEAQAYALGATLLAALGFTALRRVPGKTAREVIIGCVYVVATALSILVLSRSVQGMDALRALFNGNLLWVRWSEVATAAAVYAAVGAVHAGAYRRFVGLSAASTPGGRRAFWWELAFFATFALTITLAVNVAGVLVVFAFLIIPAFTASLLASSMAARLVLGWGLGAAGSAVGLGVAFATDLPIGATVVSLLGAMPVLAASGVYVSRRARRARSARAPRLP